MDTKKILLADPSDQVRKIIVNAFEDEDFELVTADNFDTAIEKVAAETPLLILAGISLPGKDGYALCEYVKNNNPMIPVVMLVGTDETLNSEEALRVGADDYFIRPFKSQDLIEKISDLLESFAQSASAVNDDISANAQPFTASSVVSDIDEPALVEESALIDVDELVEEEEKSEPLEYGEIPSVGSDVESSESEEPEEIEEPETPEELEECEVDIALEGNPTSDINESSKAFLTEMGIEKDEELDIVFNDSEAEEEERAADKLKLEEEEDDMLDEFLSDIDEKEIVETESDNILTDETALEDVLIGEFCTNEASIEGSAAQVNKIEEAVKVEGAADDISFNDDAIIEEPEVVGEVSGVDASVDMKGVAVDGIVEISKSKIEELIINNTKEDIKNIAYELVPGLAKDPIAKIVPEAVKRASEKLVGEISSETTAQVAEGIIAEIAAEITGQKAAEHIAGIAAESVMKAAEKRIREIATEAAREAANEIISALAEKTTIDVAEQLITEEIKNFKSKLSREG